MKAKNIINQNFLDITIFERVYNVITQLGFTSVHRLIINYKIFGFNPEVYTELEKFRAHLSGELTITLITTLDVQVNVYKMNKRSLDRAALLLQQKSSIYAN